MRVLALLAAVPPILFGAVPGRVAGWQRYGNGWAVAYLHGGAKGPCGYLERGTWRVALVSTSPLPVHLTVDRAVERSMCGNTFEWIRAGALTDGRHREVAVSITATPSLGADAFVYRLERNRLRLLRRFHADRVAIRPGVVTLTWAYAARSPSGEAREVWRWRRGRYLKTK